MLQYSPKIITDSLVMCLDASNNKSYPTDLPVKNGLALWLDAADDTTFSYSSGTSVSQWRDKSGNNRHFFQATAGNQPSRSAVINSRKAIQFTAASSQYLRYNSTIINNTTGGSVFVVWRTAGETQAYSSILDNYHCGANALGAGFQIERSAASNAYYWGFQSTGCSNAGRNVSFPVSYSDNITYIYSISKDSSNVTAFSNGASVTLESSPSATWVEDTKGWTIGCWGNGAETFGRFFNGINCEVIIFNRGLSPTEVKQINTYLGQKWGISNTDKSFIDLNNNSLNGGLSTDAVLNQNQQKSIEFRDTSGNGSRIDFGSIDLNLGSLTIDYWFKLTSDPNIDAGNTYRHMFIKNSSFYNFLEESRVINFTVIKGGVEYRRIGNYNGNIGIFGNGIVAGEDFGTQFVFDQWYNTVFVYDSSNGYGYYYLNGTLLNSGIMRQGSSPYTAITAGNVDNSTSGATFSNLDVSTTPYFFTGRLASLKLYNKPLSSAEVSSNYETMKNRFVNTIVERGLVLNLDAGNPYSYAGAGTTWIDVSGNTNNATLINSPTYSSDNSGVLNWTSASSQYATVVMTSGLRVTNITQEVWVFLNSTADQVFIGSQYGTGSNNSFALWLQGGTFYFGVNTGGTFYPSVSSAPSASTWYHLVHTYNGTTQYLYINGVLATTYNSAASGNMTYDTSNTLLAIGADFNGTGYNVGPSLYANGKMPIVKIYNIALSAAQVLQNYNATKDRFGL